MAARAWKRVAGYGVLLAACAAGLQWRDLRFLAPACSPPAPRRAPGNPQALAGVALGYLIMLVALATVFVAVRRQRDVDLGG